MTLTRLLILVLLTTLYTDFANGNGGDEIIDMTYPFDETTLAYPGLKNFELKVLHNGTTEEGYWLQLENQGAGIHIGTHLDAPCHIKKGQWTLDQIPLNRFMAPAAVVDIRHRANTNSDSKLEVEDLINWERTTRKSLNRTIVLVNSGWGKKWSNKEEFLGTNSDDVSKLHFPGVSAKAARWLARNRKIYGLGIDTTSLDYGQAKDRPAHEALFGANIYGMENVANIDKLPKYGAKLYVFPMKITNASGAPTRIIAIVPERHRTPRLQ